MSTRRNRRRQHRKHKREAARRTRNRLHRLRLGWPVSDEPVTATELAQWFAERFFRLNPALQILHFIEADARQPHRFEPRTPLPPIPKWMERLKDF